MTAPTAATRPSKTLLTRIGEVVLAALFILIGPLLIGVGAHFNAADKDLAQSGVHTTGTIVHFSDARKASNRDIRVAYRSADGSSHFVLAKVDHEQHPIVGDAVTVAYREEDPGKAVVLGYEGSGVLLLGLGTILTLVFTSIGLILVLKGRLKRRPQQPDASR